MRKLLFYISLLWVSLCFPLTIRVEIARGWRSLNVSSSVPFSLIDTSNGEIVRSSLNNLKLSFLRKSQRCYCLKILCPDDEKASRLEKEARMLGYKIQRSDNELIVSCEQEAGRKGFLERIANEDVSIFPFDEQRLEARIELEFEGERKILPPTSHLKLLPIAGDGKTPILSVSLDNNPKERRYRGVLEIFSNKDFIPILVNELDLEDYLKGVLPAEIPESFPYECLKAQAIIARTYTVYSLGRHKNEGYDLCSTPHCQIYLGYDYEKDKINKAIEETKGMIITYNDKPALTPFHSSCGGLREDGNVWGSNLPYLKSKIDGDISLDLSSEEKIKSFLQLKEGFNCSGAPDFRWRREYRADELQAIFERSLPVLLNNPSLKLGKIKDLRVAERRAFGRVSSLIIETDEGEIRLEGDNIRWAFGDGRIASRGSLPSLLFYIEKKSEGESPIFKIIGGGSGHGIGFCQWGGAKLARKGYGFSQIIFYYFPGTNLKKTIE
ncbi:MAG: SpoIID/LytB domain-containing protein [bacterium]